MKIFFARPDLWFANSSLQTLQGTVEKYLELKPEHISCYLLTLDADCKLAKEKNNLPNGEMQAEQYAFLCNYLEKWAIYTMKFPILPFRVMPLNTT